MRTPVKLLSALLLLVGIGACKDVIEPDLSNKTVSLLTPVDNDTTSNPSVTFWWEEVTDATQYRLQLVTPSFGAPQNLVIDSLVTGDKYMASLMPGTYQWRLRAENNSSHSAWFTRSLRVDSSFNLSNQVVILSAPANNVEVNQLNSINFSWFPLATATSYNLRIETVQGSVVATIPSITTSSYQYSFSSYGTYRWKVQAENSTSTSPYSTANVLNVLIPKPTSLTAPDSVTNPSPVLLSWNNTSPAIGDSIYIYQDNLSSTPIKKEYSTTKNYTFVTNSTLANHVYYWKVKSLDASGNISAWVTAASSFKVK